MFTGIIEQTGIITDVRGHGSNKTFQISSPISDELRADQSVSHDGACLTIEHSGRGMHTVTAVRETLEKTNLLHWTPGQVVNLERSLRINERLDGHIVQGHVDTTGTCVQSTDRQGSVEMRFEYPAEFRRYLIEKGSICINGISLTAYDVSGSGFSVSVVPYTFEHTNISAAGPGSVINIEFDIIGKYVERMFPGARL